MDRAEDELDAKAAAELDAKAAARRACRTGHAREVRERYGALLREGAGVVGVSPSTFSRWERGLVRPTGKAAERYGHLLALWEGKP
jgi:DNA-binding transcriptional regulator YiaG